MLKSGGSLAVTCDLQVVQCDRSQLAHELMGADVAVPLMARLDAQLLRSARRLKLIIQYGVGVEGIDMPSVRPEQRAQKAGKERRGSGSACDIPFSPC